MTNGTEMVFGKESCTALVETLSGSMDVPPLECPVTVIGTEEDAVIPLQCQHELAAYHGTELIVRPGSHMAPFDPKYMNWIIEDVQEAIWMKNPVIQKSHHRRAA